MTTARRPPASAADQKPGRRRAALLAHIFTATGAAIGLLALAAATERAFVVCFLLLGLALAVDGADGALARRLRVGETLPWMDGERLDLVVDFLTYVVVPLFALWRAQRGTDATFILACAAVASLASALYFADDRMKTRDHWFRGFPACWNLLVFYAFVFHAPALLDAIGLLVGSALLFAPIASVHPLRVRRLRSLTLVATVVWALSAATAVWTDFAPGQVAQAGLLASALYFLALTPLRGPLRGADAGEPPEGVSRGQDDPRS